jgi:hypothetical protein
MISTESNIKIINLPISTTTELTSDSKLCDNKDLIKRKRLRIINKKQSCIEKLKNQGFRVGKWDINEHMQFLKACLTHGNNWAKVFIIKADSRRVKNKIISTNKKPCTEVLN